MRDRIRKLLRQGLKGYRQVLEELSPEICTDEAEAAESASRKNLHLLTAAIAFGICVQLLIYRVPRAPFNFQALLYDLYGAGTLLAPLILVSVFRIHFAGRLLLPLAALGSLYRPPSMPWDRSSYAVIVLLVLALWFVAGRLLDFGASTASDRMYPGLRRWTLLALGLILLARSGLGIRHWDRYIPALTLAATLACCAWGWIIERWLKRREMKKDVETLLLAAMMRWGLFARGRALAVLLGLLPFFLFLNGLDLAKRLQWPEDPDILRTTRDGREEVWFWHHKGRFLSGADLGTEELYAFRDSEIAPGKLDQISKLDARLRDTVYTPENYPELAALYKELRELLADYRVRTREELGSVYAAPSGRLVLYHLDENQILAQGPVRTVPAIFSAEDQTLRLAALTHDEIDSATAHNALWQWLLLGFSLLGLTFIWRRGGDLPEARWLGIWLIGVGIVGTYRYVLVFLPALGFDLWHRSLLHPSANLWLSIIAVLNLVMNGVLYLFAFFVPCAALWVHMCWPAPREGDRRPLLVRLSFAGRIALVALCMSLVFYGSRLVLLLVLANSSSPFADVTSSVTSVLLFVVIAYPLGLGLRRRSQRKSPSLNKTSSFLLLAVQVVTLAAISITESKAGAEAFKLVALVLALFLLVVLVVMIFRQDLLHIAAARDLSFVIAFMILPALFTWSEEQVEKSMSTLFQGVSVPESGTEILWVVIAVALLPPLRSALEQVILYLSNPGLRQIRRSIEEALEALVTVGDEESVGRLREALKSCDVEDFVLYQRTGPDRFEVAGWQGSHTEQTVELSRSLRRFLCSQRDFIDLDRVALEWRFFFVQFELHRLHRSLAGRYLLPICLGTSLRAFLVVQESAAEGRRRVVGSPVIGEITTLGLAAAHLRAVAHSAQAPAPAASATLAGSAQGDPPRTLPL